MKAKTQKKANKKAEKKIEKKPAETKFGKLRAALMAKRENSVDELMRISGFDLSNLKTAISILRNPKRSKNILDTTFDKEKKVYITA